MTISVGIVAYNEEQSVYRALTTLISAAKGCDETTEVIFVASGCTDNTIVEAKRALAGHDRHTIFVENERRGKAAALNRVAKLANGELLILCDADVLIDHNALFALAQAFRTDKKLEIASARVAVLKGPNKILTKVGEMSAKALDAYRRLEHGEGLWMLCGHLYAIRRCVWEDIPEEVVSDDVYIGLRAITQGKKMAYVPAALVHICYPQTWLDYLSQKLRNRFARRQLAEASYELRQPVRWLGIGLISRLGLPALRYLPVIILDCIVVGMAEIGWQLRFRQSPLWRMIGTSKQIHNLEAPLSDK